MKTAKASCTLGYVSVSAVFLLIKESEIYEDTS